MNWELIPRIGYGASFNNIYRFENLIKKEAKNEYGKKKILKEIIFYKFLQEYPTLPTPKILAFEENSYTMEFSTAVPLFKIFPTLSSEQKKNILQNILSTLYTFHSTKQILLSKSEYYQNLCQETHLKILERFKLVEPLLKDYSTITHVNDKPLKSFTEIIELLKEKFYSYTESLHTYTYTPIHGDCQFNNILYDLSSQKFTFIDPRGSFGNSDIYGPPEYDTAKIHFALSGYDSFDSSEIHSLHIQKNCLYLPNIMLLPHCLNKNDIITTYVISIWLGNAHCFIESPKKAVYSYFYAMYLASLYL